MIIAPTRFDKIIDGNGNPTPRFAEWMERITSSMNVPGSLSGLGTAAYEDVGTEIGDVVQLEEL